MHASAFFEPELALYFPAVHLVHDAAPESANKPGSHSWQLSLVMDWVMVLAVPAGQSVHAV